MIKSKYGYFDDDGKEYIITDPFTPRPWINVISNGDYSIIVSQTGGGFSFRDNAEQNRLTRLFQDIVKDNWGKYFYIRDKKTNKYFSTTLKPMMEGYDFYEVHVGIGYTVFIREQDGIRTEMTIFVSADKPMEFISLKIKNLGNEERNLDVTNYFEWAPGIAYDNHREFQRLFTELNFNKDLNSILVNKCLWGFADEKGRYNNDDWPYVGFLSCSKSVSSYDCDKEAFIGMYNDEKTSNAMKNLNLSNSNGRFCDPCGALRVDVDLNANEEKTIVFTIGMAKKGDENVEDLIKYTSPEDANKELEKVHSLWHDLLDKDICETEDKEFDVFTNIWSKYQAISCRIWAKAAYYQISGGIGYRDQLQDSLIFLESNPNLTKKQILIHAEKQFVKGDVFHWWLTINPWGPRGNCSDDFLWLPFAVIEYINDTGDYSILNEKARYVDSDKQEPIYEHLKKAIYRSISLTSKRGVPLMGDHDWNDGLSAVGHGLKGESFWVSEFLYYILNRFEPICSYENDEEFIKVVNRHKRMIKRTFNKYGWDGEYFIQAINDEGDLIGSSKCQEGKVFLNPQIWSVISNITTKTREKKAMKAVDEYLFRDYGCVLLYPAYEKPNREIGYITRYAPGLRENGGVYTHAATWATWAYSLIGNNKKAYESYIRINPPHRSKDIDVYKSEPYVTCGNSDGPISPYYGKGGWSWYSGSAQWMHSVAIKNILGIQGVGDGIQIKPCIPKKWKGYKYTRMFEDIKLDIIVTRTGKNRIVSNGKEVEGNVVHLDKSVKNYKIEVEII